MSKKGVAELIGVAPNTVHRYESGASVPQDDVIEALADALNFPKIFFYGEDLDTPRLDNASFRGLASKSGRVMKAALASGGLAYKFDDWVGQRYDRMTLDLPEYKEGITPKMAAKLLRQEWRLGDKPIENMVHLLEAKGIRVFSLAENTKDVDAFSVWRDDVPYVFLNSFKSSERSRFDAAHELAHLCLHKHGGSAAEHKNSPIEAEANEFAGAFLMPESDLRAIVQGTVYNIEDLLVYKKRLLEIGIIREQRSNSIYVEMSRRGWLRNEPESCEREKSSTWQQIMDDLRNCGVTKNHISNETGVPVKELEALLFGLANMLSIEGEGLRTPRRSVDLRLVQ